MEAFEAVAVQPRVDEAERALAFRNLVVIKQRDNACHDLYVGGQLDAQG